jgi:O-antigen ligase
VRIWATSLLAVGCVAGGLWIYHARGLSLEDTHDPGTQFRRLMWEDGVRLARQHPWFGVGMETTRLHWQEWNIRGFALYHVQSHFHSTPLQIAVERGLPALIAWVWFVVAYLVFLVGLLRRTRARSRFASGVVSGVLAGFVAFQTTSLVHYNLGEEPLVMVLFFYFGLALAIDRMLKTPGAVDVP